MERSAGWDEMILLLFGDVAFVGFWWLLLIFRWLCTGVTHPQPLSRGENWIVLFLFDN